jgi:iron complex transport system ATP-binding protein
MTMILETRGLTIGYPDRVVAESLDLTLMPGDVVALLGPNGTGKSTLLRTLSGLLPALSGDIELVGSPLTELSTRERARRLGVVLTERPETGWLTGFDLAAIGRYPHTGWGGRLSADDIAIVDRALTMVGAETFRERPVASLSDGERQRVMMARALAQSPRLLLLDEVTSFLDLPRRVAFFALLTELAEREGYAIVVSTHELELALRCANRLWLYDGMSLLDGAPEDLILSGDFARVFAADDVRFDLEAGHFELRRPAQRFVALNGEGARAAWTRRALDRVGIGIDANAERTIMVDIADWRLDGQAHPSIASLLTALG